MSQPATWITRLILCLLALSLLLPGTLAAEGQNPESPSESPATRPSFTAWQPTSTVGAPHGRYGHSTLWTGNQMLVWGGYFHLDNFLGDGALYNPVSDVWTPISSVNAPIGRLRHTAVWTGTQMIVWGGESYGGGQTTNTGGLYTPGTDTWAPTSLVNAPSNREWHSAVWTGTEMIIWGGCTDVFCSIVLNDGGRYNPSTDTWIPMNGPPEARRAYHRAVWTGNRMIVWGGPGYSQAMSYDPVSDSWTPISTTNQPVPTFLGTLLWTGNEMIAWGGCTAFSNDGCSPATNAGGRYNPATDTWSPMTIRAAPSPRYNFSAVWADNRMIVWGGGTNDGVYADGASYNPRTNKWTTLDITGAPNARANHTAVWAGNRMVVWGGCSSSPCGAVTFYDTGGRYTPGKP